MKKGTVTVCASRYDSILRGDQPVVRVLTLVEGYVVAGVPRAVLGFSRQASRIDLGLPRIELSVLTYTRGGVETDFIRAARDHEIPVDVVNERYRFDINVIAQIRAAVRRREPDLIWTNSVKSHFLVRVSRLHLTIPWLAFHHGYTATDWLNLAYNQVDRWSLRGPNRIATVCHAFRADLSRRTGVPLNHIDVQHSSIPPTQAVTRADVALLRHQIGIDEETRVVLAVGRLSKEKGHADLVHAIWRVRQANPAMALRVLILGDGPERSRLEALCSELNLGGTVSFLGYRTDARYYYALADVFVLPSHSEGSPNVLLEAMAAGLPVVATAVGGVPEMMRNETDALLVEGRDIAALEQGIVRLLTDGPLRRRLGGAGQGVLNRHLPEDHFRSIRSILLNTVRTACTPAP